MPTWVHRAAGLGEVCIVLLRTCGALTVFNCGSPPISSDGAARCASLALCLACILMGGALYTWPVIVGVPLGLVPGVLVLLASTWATLSLASAFLSPQEAAQWLTAAIICLVVGTASAGCLHVLGVAASPKKRHKD
eukprot:CAMPEP_0194526982 /NCGR_PEP_ID=MMETSP0253-20130528/62953_1 /TAXON_ID=2966 /ORGANISM="Noctiluca scintillans" /LENGTH=135 /DNA_ID=CAMNT_0039371859 /DNA_START=102 /DNA_END=509 /DNA_ORIENTATION=-